MDSRAEGVSAYALRRGTWESVLARFNADVGLQARIHDLLDREQAFLALNQDTGPDARPESYSHTSTRKTHQAPFLS